MIREPITHITTMFDGSKTPYSNGFIVKATPSCRLDHAEALASYWMREATNIHHFVVISEAIEIRSIDATLKVTKP